MRPKTSVLTFALILVACSFVQAQNVRVSIPFPSVTSQYTTPFLVANIAPNLPIIAVCNFPANNLPCTNYATTYTSSAVACSNGAQDTPDPQPSACQSTGDAQGNLGFWIPPGTYSYTVCIQNSTSCFGPYTVTAAGFSPAGAAGGNLSGTYPNPRFSATQIWPNTTTMSPASGSLIAWDLGTNDWEIMRGGNSIVIGSGITVLGGGLGQGVLISGQGTGVAVGDFISGIGAAIAGLGAGTSAPGVPVQGNISRIVHQSAGFSSTTVFTAPNAGAYRIMASAYCDTSQAAATATLTVTYVDISGTTQSVTGSGAACTTLGSSSLQQIEIPLAILQNAGTVKWAIVVANSPTYDAAIQVEQLSFQ